MKASVVLSIAMLAFLAAATAAGAQERDVKTYWSIHPLTLRQPMPGAETIPIWVGVRNERREPRMVCVLSEGYMIGTTADPYAESTGAMHACREDGQFTIVLPGETYFYVMTMELKKDWQKGPLEVSLLLTDFDDSGERHRSDVKWSGRFSSLVEAGKKIRGGVAR
jgi:hypothetical protein